MGSTDKNRDHNLTAHMNLSQFSIPTHSRINMDQAKTKKKNESPFTTQFDQTQIHISNWRKFSTETNTPKMQRSHLWSNPPTFKRNAKPRWIEKQKKKKTGGISKRWCEIEGVPCVLGICVQAGGFIPMMKFIFFSFLVSILFFSFVEIQGSHNL